MPEIPAGAEAGFFGKLTRGLFRDPVRGGETAAARDEPVLARHDGPPPAAPEQPPPADPAGTPPPDAPLPRYGPFHRRASPTQTLADTQKAIASGEHWGSLGRYTLDPVAKAHAGPLPDGMEGFEFYSDVAPNPSDVPTRANWSLGRPGVELRTREDGKEFAAIPIVITHVNHEDIKWPRPDQS